LAGKPAAKNPDAKKVRELERDLDRKNKALAEVTALLALQKKALLTFLWVVPAAEAAA